MPDGAITCNANKRGPSEWFTVEWKGPRLSLIAANGNVVSVKKNGGLQAVSTDPAADDSTFLYEIINRPNLVLRGEFGFVGTLPSGFLECNRSEPDVFTLEITAGYCKISGADGKYWKLNVNGITVSGAEPDLFTMEFVEHSKLLLKAPNGNYVQGSQNGGYIPYNLSR